VPSFFNVFFWIKALNVSNSHFSHACYIPRRSLLSV
jgi:hypothetical protein